MSRLYERPLRSDELMHYGILGMHWGIRRYQNPDGTLTDAGKKRLSKNQKQFRDATVNNQYSETFENYSKLPLVKKMSCSKTIKKARKVIEQCDSDYRRVYKEELDEVASSCIKNSKIDKSNKYVKEALNEIGDRVKTYTKDDWKYYIDNYNYYYGSDKKDFPKTEKVLETRIKAHDDYIKIVKDSVKDLIGDMADDVIYVDREGSALNPKVYTAVETALNLIEQRKKYSPLYYG